MNQLFIGASEQAILTVNSPLIVFNIIVNIFYECCLIFTQSKRLRLKQPLKTVLGLLVTCSIMYCASLISLYWVIKENILVEVLIISWMVVVFFVHNSMTCSVWLNFCYYIQIVPVQRAFLVWVKKNIRSVIITILIFDGMLFVLDSALIVTGHLYRTSSINSSWSSPPIQLGITSQVCFILIRLHMLLCLFIMTASSVSTFQYLHKHIRSVTQGSSFSRKTLRSQIRVTITGICQGVLYFLYDAIYLFEGCVAMFAPHIVVSTWIPFSATTVYITATTINLGIGQAIFRSRMTDAWKKLKAKFGIGMATNDVKMHSSQLVRDEISQTVETQMRL